MTASKDEEAQKRKETEDFIVGAVKRAVTELETERTKTRTGTAQEDASKTDDKSTAEGESEDVPLGVKLFGDNVFGRLLS